MRWRWKDSRYFVAICSLISLCLGIRGIDALPIPLAESSPMLFQITATPSSPMPPKFPSRLELPPITIENPMRAGMVQVAVELAEPPAAALLASLGQNASPAVVEVLIQMHTLLILERQSAVLKALTAPPIEAVILGRMGTLVNVIGVQVDAAKIDLIRKIPGVKGVSMVVITAPDVQKPDGGIAHPDVPKDTTSPQDQQGGADTQ